MADSSSGIVPAVRQGIVDIDGIFTHSPPRPFPFRVRPAPEAAHAPFCAQILERADQ